MLVTTGTLTTTFLITVLPWALLITAATFLVTVLPRTLLIAASLDESPKALTERGVQRLDQYHEIEVLGGPKIEADLFHDDFAGRPADQHIVVR